MTSTPLVSIVMPVYNSESFLNDSIESILNQTYTNFEFIIIDDASFDNSASVINEYKDSRMLFVKNTSNKGNYACRNIGNRMAKGKYIAVMDSDDIAMNERLAVQVGIMEQDEGILALGSDFMFYSQNGDLGICKKLKEYQLMKIFLLHNNIALHPSLMIRYDVFRDIGFYDEFFYYSSDYDLLCRLSQKGKIVGTDRILMKYRLHNKQISSVETQKQADYADIVRLNYFDSLGFKQSEMYRKVLTKAMRYKKINNQEMDDLINLFNLILCQNETLLIFDDDLLFSFFDLLIKNIIVEI